MKKFILFSLLFLSAFIILSAKIGFSDIIKNGPMYSWKQAEFMPSLNEAGRKISQSESFIEKRDRFFGLIKSTIDYEKKHGGIHKKTVIKDLKMELNKKHLGPFPLIPVGTFNGKLKKTGTIKVVFGVGGNNPGTMMETLGNINFMLRYAEFHHEKYKISVVFYGAMSRLIMILPAFIYNTMERYHKKGVKFYVCYNALMINGFVASNLPHYIKTVPMSVLKIYLLRKEGYIYFTNP